MTLSDPVVFPCSLGALLDRRGELPSIFQATELLRSGARSWLQQHPDKEDQEKLAWLHEWTMTYLLKRIELVQPRGSEMGTFSRRSHLSIIRRMPWIGKPKPRFDSQRSCLTYCRMSVTCNEYPNNFAAHVTFVAQVLTDDPDRVLADPGAESEFDWLLETVCRRFLPYYKLKGTKRDRTGNEMSSTDCGIDPEHLAHLLHQLSRRQAWDFHSALLDRIALGIDTVPTPAFSTLFIPLLAKLADHFKSDPEHMSRYETFFQRIVRTFQTRCVQLKPTTGTWACDPEGCGRCKDCQKLDDFLRDPRRPVELFPVSKNRRMHLHQLLEDTGHSHETNRNTKPETLVVKKKISTSQRVSQQWEARVTESEKLLRDMDQTVLQKLLGSNMQR